MRTAEELLRRQSEGIAQLEADRSALRGQLQAESAAVHRLEQSLAERDLAAQALEARGAELAAEAERLRADAQQLREALAMRTALLEQREAALAESEASATAAGDRANQGERFRSELESELTELRRRTTAYLEALQSNLGRRDVYESACAGLEARIAELERAGSELTDERDSARREAESLRAQLAEQQASGVTGEALQILRTDLEARGARLLELDEQLRAAGENAALHEEQSRVSLQQMQQTLEEREARIRQLESAAAGQAAALGDLQHSIQHIDSLAQSGADIPPQGPKRLLIRCDGESEVVHVLGRRMTIGRTPDNDLQIDTKFISRHHAVLLAGPVHTIIEDLGSTNGVLVNDRRIQRRALKDGDRVLIGKTSFRFVVRPIDASS